MFDEIHQVVLDGISDNISALVHPVKYGFINTDDTKTNEFYVIQLISEAYTLKKHTQIDIFVSAGELAVRAQYLCSIQENINFYLKKNGTATEYHGSKTHKSSSMS